MNLSYISEKFSRGLFSKGMDLPLNQDSSAKFVPWIIGMMLYWALLLAFCATIFFQEKPSQTLLDMPHLTIEIPVLSKDRHVFEQTLPPALKSFPEITQWRIIPLQEIQTTLRNFFHEDIDSLGGLEAEPLLVDLWVKEGLAPAVATKINQKLSFIAPDIQVLLHQPWTRPLLQWMAWLRWGAFGGIILFMTGLLAVVAFAVKTGLSIHRPILNVLDLMGASEIYIIRQFQRQNLIIFFKSLAIMFVFFDLTLLGIHLFFEIFAETDVLHLHNILSFSGGVLGGIVLCGFFISLMTGQVVKSALRRTLIPDV